MKNIFTKALLIASMTLFSVLPMAAQALGTSCENPYIVTKEFNTAISEPGSYWFSLTTYDLPLRVRYTPDIPTGETMKAYVDFSCTPGVYDDPNLYELTDFANGWGFEMPLPFESKEVDGVHEIMMYESYRAIMTTFGILYNVEVKINVEIPQAGSVAVIPDTIFRHTVENSHWIKLPDTIDVGLSTVDSMYIMPITDWADDSVRIEWLGKDAPVSIWISKQIDFVLDERNPDVIAHYTLDPTKGNTVLDLSKDFMQGLLDGLGSGMYFVKIITAEDAKIVFDHKPMSPEMARAIPMEMDKAVEVKANNIDQYYYFDKEWSDDNIRFQIVGNDDVIAYFGATPTFALDEALAQYSFSLEDRNSILNLSVKQLISIANGCASDHIFVRFASTSNTLLTPMIWEVGNCVSNSVMEILPDGVVSIAANKKNDIYRIDYNKWSKGDTEVTWTGRLANKVYLADDCSFNLSASDEHVLFYQSVNANKSFVITKDFLDSVEDRVSEDGYLYFRFDTRIKGNLQTVFTLDSTSIPVEPDLPAIPTTECSLSSLPLAQGDQVTLNLDSAFTVYRIDYKAWLKSGATLTWNGAEALHTFVAETCAFALAPYNRYVLAYIPVPAQGDIVLDTAQLAAMEEYVSEDGFLYIRFLTKEEGVLEVK